MFGYFSKESRAQRVAFRVAESKYEEIREELYTRYAELPRLLANKIGTTSIRYHEDNGNRLRHTERDRKAFKVLFFEGEIELAEAAVIVHEVIKDLQKATLLSMLEGAGQMMTSFHYEKDDAVEAGVELSAAAKQFSFGKYKDDLKALWERVILLCEKAEADSKTIVAAAETTIPTCSRFGCNMPLAYRGAVYCGAACSARDEIGQG